MRRLIFSAGLILLTAAGHAQPMPQAGDKTVREQGLANKTQAAATPAVGKPSPKAKSGSAVKPKAPASMGGAGGFYLVKPGETLYSIGITTGVGQQRLAEWNGLPATGLVKAGQKLKLFPSPRPAVQLGVQGKPPAKPAQAVVQQPAVKSQPAPAAKPQQAPAVPIKITALPDSITLTPLPEKSSGKAQPVPAETGKKPLKAPVPAHKIISKPMKTATAKPIAVVKGQAKGDLKPLAPVAKKIPPSSVSKPKRTGIKPDLAIKKPDISINNKKVLKLSFQWPIKGIVLTNFSKTRGKGIDIANRQDKQRVNAAEAGKVVYQGRGLAGYGNLIVIKHSNDYSTVYANNSHFLVKDGQVVKKGQAIAEIFAAGARQRPLHFEIRKNGQVLEALAILPKH